MCKKSKDTHFHSFTLLLVMFRAYIPAFSPDLICNGIDDFLPISTTVKLFPVRKAIKNAQGQNAGRLAESQKPLL